MDSSDLKQSVSRGRPAHTWLSAEDPVSKPEDTRYVASENAIEFCCGES